MKRILIALATILISFSQSFAQVQIACDDVELASEALAEVTYVEAIEKLVRDSIEACEVDLREDMLVASELHPFVASLHYAYADHRPLVISPDMIWLLICQGFSKHIDYNGERLRDKFVDFEGKKTITIATESLSLNFHKGSIHTPWRLAFPAFADSIRNYVGDELHGLFVQSFSTTTFMEKAAFEVTLMDGMDSYFEYAMTTACGIPMITLEGTTEDWEKIQSEIQKLRGYEIDNWVTTLEPIVDEFVKASKNEINHEFWSEIYKVGGGSGGPYLTGWFVKFFPYLKTTREEGRFNPYIEREMSGPFAGLNTSDFFRGISKADLKWNYHSTDYEMELLAGFIGMRQDKETMALRPEIGWAVKEKKEEE